MTAAAANTLPWFAAHEGRLIWRDFVSLMTGGKTRRKAIMGTIVAVMIVGMHWFAAFLLRPAFEVGIAADKTTFMFISGGLIMFMSLMFSQAIEAVTRAYYARSDLDLIMSSPSPAHRLFQVRTSVLAVQTIALSVLIAAPVINVLVWKDGVHWLGAYAVLISLGALATAIAVIITLTLFRMVGTARTRLIAQIIAAIVGAGFVIALQGVAIVFGKGISRFSFFTSSDTISSAPETVSFMWIPARASMGEPLAVLAILGFCFAFLALVIAVSSQRFAKDVLATAGLVERKTKTTVFSGFRMKTSLRATLRRKEWALLRRDPWLLSQSLQQILYLLPPALLLYVNYGSNHGIVYVVVPVIVMAVGQLAGGLAWITISGEDAHELIATAPVSDKTILRAKVEAVLVVVALILAPFAVVLSFISYEVVFWMLVGGALSASSAVLIQLWFRSQANRSVFRRRQTSSRAATLCEALVSILWAATAGAAMADVKYAPIPGTLVLMVLFIGWLIKPSRKEMVGT